MNETIATKAKRWAPLAGTAVLVGVVLLRLFGFEQGAAMVEGVGGAVGVTNDSAVGLAELTAALTALFGVCAKVYSQYRKSKDGADTVSLR